MVDFVVKTAFLVGFGCMVSHCPGFSLTQSAIEIDLLSNTQADPGAQKNQARKAIIKVI